MSSIANEVWKSQTFKTIDLIAIGANCKLRKVADTEYRILAALIKQLGGDIPATGLPTDKVWNKFIEIVDKKKQLIIFIFDEIDTGIGGSTANLVGKQIKKLSETKQILCITHLPQIAKYADFHLFVEKKEEQNKTKVFIRNLEGEEKVKELARMLSGDTESKVAIDHAKSLIDE